MDFQEKNFEYITQEFGAFLDGVERGDHLYLRALSHDARGKTPTKLADDFPTLAPDFHLPRELEFVHEHAHSSPLRISGPVNMWLHYDVMANIYCQIRGRKRLVLFPPADISHLAFDPGASSSSLDIFDPDAASGPASTSESSSSLSHTHPFETTLDPGDILFIPALWSHTSAAAPDHGVSVAVNVFFRNLPAHGYAAGRDVYGNRDLAAYERGRRDLARIVQAFEHLPPDVAGFYLDRLAGELGEEARKVGRNAGVLHTVYAELG
jgi:tRNA wybutosine-synthesizing protein 4